MYYRETRTPNSDDLELLELATHVVRVAIERDRAAEALRASERVARGQVEALTYSLDVLATAPAPDKFLGQMLSTMGRMLGAQSVILWLLNESNDSLVLRAWAEGTNFTKVDAEHPFIKNPQSWKEDPGVRELFFSGAPVACEDVENDPYSSDRASRVFEIGRNEEVPENSNASGRSGERFHRDSSRRPTSLSTRRDRTGASTRAPGNAGDPTK